MAFGHDAEPLTDMKPGPSWMTKALAGFQRTGQPVAEHL
jgi:hypothetical protein